MDVEVVAHQRRQAGDVFVENRVALGLELIPEDMSGRPSMTAMTLPRSPSVRIVEKLPRPLRMAFSSTSRTRHARRRRALANSLPCASTRAMTLCQRSP